MLRSILLSVLLSLLIIVSVPSMVSSAGPPTPSVQAVDDTLYYVPSDDDWYWDHIERTIC
jgi:hypothetical protein